MTAPLPWFRMYSDFIFDEKIEFLAFEDQRHFVFVLCMKNLGLIDKEYPQPGMLDRVVAKRLGLYGEAFENAKARLVDAGLIDEAWQPLAWCRRQFRSDTDPTAADRKRRQREREKQGLGDVTRDTPVTSRTGHADVTRTDTDTDTDTEEEKNKKQAKPRAFDALSYLVSAGVPEGVANDWLALRKGKRAPATLTAIAGVEREAAKAGLSLSDAVRYCCELGWAGFNAGWYADRQAKHPAQGGNKNGNGKRVAGLSGVI